MGRRAGVVVVSAVVLVAALVVGVRLLTGSPEEPAAARSATGSPSPLPSTASSTSVVVPAYFVGESVPGRRLFLTQQRYDATGDTAADRLSAAVRGVVAGDSGDNARTSGFPDGTTASVSRDDGDVVVDLRGADGTDLTTGDAATGSLALQSVVWTVGAVLGRDVPVRFTLDGSESSTLLGVDAATPVAKTDELSTLAPVQIESPGVAAVSSPFTVSGRAAANEATVSWRLESLDGSVSQQGTTTAQECCTLSPYTFQVEAPAGRYTLTVSDTDDSGAGRLNADSRTVTVQ